MNIAILEDNPAICEYLTIALQMAGHQVAVHTQAASLLEALFPEGEVRHPLPYDLLTVDLFLPGGISGVEVITRIRETLSSQQLPLVIITGAGEPIVEQVKKAFPDVPLIVKPFKLRTLLQLLEVQKRSRENQLIQYS